MDMKQFDVFLVDLEPTRPVVIISPDVMNKYLQTVIVAPMTHTIKGYPSRVSCQFKGQSGEIALDQLRAVDKARLVKKVGVIDSATSQGIKTLLHTMFS